MKILFNKASPPLGGILAVAFYKSFKHEIELIWTNQFAVIPRSTRKPEPFETCYDLIRILENNYNKSADPIQKDMTNKWLSFCAVLENEMPESLEYFEQTLNPVTYLVGDKLSVSDLAVYAVLYGSIKFEEMSKIKPYNNINIWMQLIQSKPIVSFTLDNLSIDILNKVSPPSKRKPQRLNIPFPSYVPQNEEGKYVEVPWAEMHQLVVKFSVQPYGYLHIGHVKAILNTQYYQRAYKGKLIIRFDDIHPGKESAEIEKVILEDLEMLYVKPDKVMHMSDYFVLMLHYCKKLLMDGKAFVDDTPAEQMEAEREENVESRNRNNSVEKNLELWEEMKEASETGVQCCVRAKIDMQSPNRFMRDPVLYRCIPKTHPRTGNNYNVYPTLDFASPIADSLTLTHVFGTTKDQRRESQYCWILKAINIKIPYIWSNCFSRLNMTNTLLSRTQLSWFVDQGLVDGWDDPRLPTLRGLQRRGLVLEKLRDLLRKQYEYSVTHLNWDVVWALNRKVIDPTTPRYTALKENPVPVNLKGVEESTLTVPLHPRYPDLGTKTVWVSPKLLIDQTDAKALKEGENATFINYGNVMIDQIHISSDGTVTSVDATPNLDNKDSKKTLKLTWLADSPNSPAQDVKCVYFDHIISKPVLKKVEDFKQFIQHPTKWEVVLVGESALRSVVAGDVVQLQRRGYFRADVAPAPPSPRTARAEPLVLFHVPDGHTKQAIS